MDSSESRGVESALFKAAASARYVATTASVGLPIREPRSRPSRTSSVATWRVQ
jgi:hypothetical protein